MHAWWSFQWKAECRSSLVDIFTDLFGDYLIDLLVVSRGGGGHGHGRVWPLSPTTYVDLNDSNETVKVGWISDSPVKALQKGLLFIRKPSLPCPASDAMLDKMVAWWRRNSFDSFKVTCDCIGSQPEISDRLRYLPRNIEIIGYLRRGRVDPGKGQGEWCEANECPKSTKQSLKPPPTPPMHYS